MQNITRKAGSTDVSVVIRIVDSTDGSPETAVTSGTAGLALEYRRELATSTAITESDLAAVDSAHSDGGMKHIGNGYYRLDLPDAACAAASAGCLVHGTATGMVVVGCYIDLTQTPADVTHWLGTAAATPTVAGVPEVDVTHWLGTAAATPTVAGVPEVDVTHFNGTAGTFAAGIPEVKLTDGAQGGSAAVLTLKRLIVANTTNAQTAVDITSTGTGNAHAVYINANAGQGIAIGSTSNYGMSASSGSSTGLYASSANFGTRIGTVRKNVALASFMFQMFDSTNHAPATGKTPAVTRSIDGGAFGAGTLGAVSEVSGGWYKCNLGAGDLNGDVIAFRATNAGCDDTNLLIVTGV